MSSEPPAKMVSSGRRARCCHLDSVHLLAHRRRLGVGPRNGALRVLFPAERTGFVLGWDVVDTMMWALLARIDVSGFGRMRAWLWANTFRSLQHEGTGGSEARLVSYIPAAMPTAATP